MGCNSKFNKYTKSLNEKTELSFWEWGSHSDEYETVFWDVADIDRYFSGVYCLCYQGDHQNLWHYIQKTPFFKLAFVIN